MTYQRYAIYYLPQPGPLADFGASWLGWDCQTGQAAAHPVLEGLPRPVSEITATPRKYGLHGTLKPPFYLAEGMDEAGLNTALDALCASAAPLSLSPLELSQLGGFLALKISGDQTPLADLASRIVKELDAFRAPPSEAELERRRKRPLSDLQEANLAAYGYPYVMEEFRFHITLSGNLPKEDAAAVKAALDPVITPLLPERFEVRDLALLGSDAAGMFHLIRRVPLTG